MPLARSYGMHRKKLSIRAFLSFPWHLSKPRLEAAACRGCQTIADAAGVVPKVQIWGRRSGFQEALVRKALQHRVLRWAEPFFEQLLIALHLELENAILLIGEH